MPARWTGVTARFPTPSRREIVLLSLARRDHSFLGGGLGETSPSSAPFRDLQQLRVPLVTSLSSLAWRSMAMASVLPEEDGGWEHELPGRSSLRLNFAPE